MTAGPQIVRDEASSTNEFDKVMAFLRDQLLSGRLKTGDRLRPERDLAAALHVSRPVVREALRALATIGVLDIQRGYGTVVKKPDFTALSEFFSILLAQQLDVFDDILQARIAIERHAIRLACERASSADIARIERAFSVIVTTMSDADEGGAADFAFHTEIVEASHSQSLSSIYDAIGKLLVKSHAERRAEIAQIPGIETYLIDHHRKILDAIKERDAGRADIVMIEHFKIGAELRMKGLESRS